MKPLKIFLIGFMGSGKSFTGEKLASALMVPFIDLDAEIELREGNKIADIFKLKGEAYFRELEAEMLEDIVLGKNSFIMACGGGTPCFFNNLDLLKSHGKVIWLNPSVEELMARLKKETEKRPLLAGMSEEELRTVITAKLSERSKYYEKADKIYSGGNPDELISIINKWWSDVADE